MAVSEIRLPEGFELDTEQQGINLPEGFTLERSLGQVPITPQQAGERARKTWQVAQTNHMTLGTAKSLDGIDQYLTAATQLLGKEQVLQNQKDFDSFQEKLQNISYNIPRQELTPELIHQVKVAQYKEALKEPNHLARQIFNTMASMADNTGIAQWLIRHYGDEDTNAFMEASNQFTQELRTNKPFSVPALSGDAAGAIGMFAKFGALPFKAMRIKMALFPLATMPSEQEEKQPLLDTATERGKQAFEGYLMGATFEVLAPYLKSTTAKILTPAAIFGGTTFATTGGNISEALKQGIFGAALGFAGKGEKSKAIEEIKKVVPEMADADAAKMTQVLKEASDAILPQGEQAIFETPQTGGAELAKQAKETAQKIAEQKYQDVLDNIGEGLPPDAPRPVKTPTTAVEGQTTPKPIQTTLEVKQVEPVVLLPQIETAFANAPQSLKNLIDVKRVKTVDFSQSAEYEGTGGNYQEKSKTVFVDKNEPDQNTILVHETAHNIVEKFGKADASFIEDYIKERYADRPPQVAERFLKDFRQFKILRGTGGFTNPVEERMADDIATYVLTPEKLSPNVKKVFDNKFNKPTETTTPIKETPNAIPQEEVQTPKVEVPVITPAESIPVGETKPQTLSTSVAEIAMAKHLTKELGEIPEYSVMNMEEQARIFNNSDYNTLKEYAKTGQGELPNGLRPLTAFKMVEYKAAMEGDVETLYRMKDSPIAHRGSLLGQEIKAADVRDKIDVIGNISDIESTSKKAYETRTKEKFETAKSREVGTIEAEVAKEVKKTLKVKETWDSFIKSLEC